MTRFELLHSWINREGFGLEIGPLHAPIAPKRDGWRVETLDHADADTLRTRYRNSPDVDASLIEDVDYVSDGRSLAEVVGGRNRYDWILASHVAEHVPDFLGFLLDCETILKSSGKLVLALPDKRQCFDAFRPPSRTGEVLQAHLEKRARHTPGQGFDFLANSIELDGKYAWNREQKGKIRFQYPLHVAYALFREMAEQDKYRDLHGWVFVPASFRLIVEEVFQMGLCALREDNFHRTMGIEFFAALSSKGKGPDVSREELILSAARAEVEGLASLAVSAPVESSPD